MICELRDRQEVEAKKLHFAFMFASPLVLRHMSATGTGLKMIPQLSYQEEFATIRQKLIESKIKLTITKRQCTVQSIKEILKRQPLGIHFSGHGFLKKNEVAGVVDDDPDECGYLLLETSQGDYNGCLMQAAIRCCCNVPLRVCGQHLLEGRCSACCLYQTRQGSYGLGSTSFHLGILLDNL
jgi:hypothetical protein